MNPMPWVWGSLWVYMHMRWCMRDLCSCIRVMKVIWRVNLRVWWLPIFNLLGPECMDNNDFQGVYGRRGLNTKESNRKISLLGVKVIWVDLLGIVCGEVFKGFTNDLVMSSSTWGKWMWYLGTLLGENMIMMIMYDMQCNLCYGT